MKRLNLNTAELIAGQARSSLGIGQNEPVNMKTLVRQLNCLTVYRPLSERLFGLSLKSAGGEDRFILVNSNSTRGCQHFTIAHELFHLLFDEDPKPHFCGKEEGKDPAERSADMFASALLMPQVGVISKIPANEIAAKSISIDTALRIGQLYGVSHSTLVIRLKELRIISSPESDRLMSISVRKEAAMRGYDGALYEKGNEGLVIGDFGSLARRLFDEEKISEGHYMELLNMIGYGESENSAGC